MSTQTVTTEGPRSKRALILRAAIESFGDDGFEHTKWASVADKVGIGQTALYHYFESKVHCLLTIMSSELERSSTTFSTGPSKPSGSWGSSSSKSAVRTVQAIRSPTAKPSSTAMSSAPSTQVHTPPSLRPPALRE